jgi:hypothetical protein
MLEKENISVCIIAASFVVRAQRGTRSFAPR